MGIKHAKRRRYLEQKYNCHYYSKMEYYHAQDCAYCGMDAQCTDHVPPLFHMENIDVKEYKKNGGECIIYPSCIECNNLLGQSIATDFYERLDILSRKYQKKADSMEVWTKHELSQMGRMLKSYIESHQHKIKIWLFKLEAIEDKKLSIELKDEKED
jgi:hypothetical protein